MLTTTATTTTQQQQQQPPDIIQNRVFGLKGASRATFGTPCGQLGAQEAPRSDFGTIWGPQNHETNLKMCCTVIKKLTKFYLEFGGLAEVGGGPAAEFGSQMISKMFEFDCGRAGGSAAK